MHIFISAGEPSGDLHGANLVRTIRERQPLARVVGFGGERMQAAGTELLFPLTQLSVMWIGRVIANLGTFFRLADQAERYFRHHQPDALIVIDYPGFNFALAKRAHALGIPVYYYVPPQLWAWAGWRARKVRRLFSGVLTALPFEDEWYRRRHIKTHYVGHPYFDELAAQRLDPAFLADQLKTNTPIIAVLPGSRNQEVEKNFPSMLEAMHVVHQQRPEVRFLVASFNELQKNIALQMVRDQTLPIEFHVGRTAEIIEAATVCLSVSGSVSLEMMYRLKPAAIVYRVGGLFYVLAKAFFMNVRYFTLVNLLAEEEIYPEFGTVGNPGKAVASQLLRWLSDRAEYQTCVDKLRALREQVAVPGACGRSADVLIEAILGVAMKAPSRDAA